MLKRPTAKKSPKSLSERFAEAIEMPKDVIASCSKITAYNDNQIIVENYKGIFEYTAEKIRIKTCSGILYISGSGLSIRAVTDTDILIEGTFNNVGWE